MISALLRRAFATSGLCSEAVSRCSGLCHMVFKRVVFRLHLPYLGTIGQEQTYSSASGSASASCALVFLTVDLKAVPNQHLLQ
ncbi:hypothetical protein K466DRAFT_171797 [Polyporus arcularius HHB13444]|uniref:Uncharacterized protein n=1 Tax=Polyporus arcularius HHB13444 TaxID=1314778 RepID=A0A5C3P8D2_9APHY|nr:hypothetical protein K466DRAFT_171797 [Polyporus arcularius HHB13444]